jgi:hypothetical protein
MSQFNADVIGGQIVRHGLERKEDKSFRYFFDGSPIAFES